MYRAHPCEQYRAAIARPDSTVLKDMAARLVEQFRGELPGTPPSNGKKRAGWSRVGNHELECRSELRRTERAKCSVRPDVCRCPAGCAAAARIWARLWPNSSDAAMTPICARPAIARCERRMSADRSASSVAMTRRLQPIANSAYCNPGGCHASPCRCPCAATGVRP
jgi:hypothetical protein